MAEMDGENIRKAVSAAKLIEYTRRIARWERLSGSDGEARAFDYVEATLRGFGLEVRRYVHDALISWPGSASLKMVDHAAGGEIECVTHAFASPTPPDGLTLDVLDLADGDYTRGEVRGKAVLLNGLATPAQARAAEEAGAAAAIFINPPQLHEMIISTVWGAPTPETLHTLPKLCAISVRKEDGARLRARAHEGGLRVHVQASVDTRWRKTPLLTADLAGAVEPDNFVLFHAHIDSWHFGAMDNASANAIQIETARILARRRPKLRRGVRFAFWSGHSHGRYSGSTWYADNHWHELYRHAVLDLNVDSAGGMGATVLSEAQTMAETWPLAAACVRAVAGQDLEYRRIRRMGDHSFLGIGMPAMFVDISYQAIGSPTAGETFSYMADPVSKSGGLGWWWHTVDDTVDKVDPANLHRDAEIYALVLWHWCTAPVLPLDYRETAREFAQILDQYCIGVGDAVDLSPATEAIERLTALAQRMYAAATQLTAEWRGRGTKRQRNMATALNTALMCASRALVPINYTAGDPFAHDPAIALPTLPALAPVHRLAAMGQGTSDWYTLRTRIERERNKVVHAVERANDAMTQALATIDRGR